MAENLSESARLWWRRPDDVREDEDPKAHEKLRAAIDFIVRNQPRKRDMLLWGAMYAGGIPPAGGGMAVDSYARTSPGNRGNLSLNVSRNVVDAVVSRIFAKSEPHMTYATEGGGYEKQHDAHQLEMGVSGAFYQDVSYPKFVLMGRDACVYGTGFCRVVADRDERRARVERWRAYEVILDDGEALYDGVRSFYTRRYYDKFVVEHRVRAGIWCEGSEEDLADKAERISRLSGDADDDAEFGAQQVALRVAIDEAWRLPSGRDAGDGRHVIGCKNCTILDEPWQPRSLRRPWPFAWYKWSEPIEGFYGQGIIELGGGVQAEINKLVREIQTGHHLIKGMWLVESGSSVRAAHIQNDLSNILQYKGIAPEYRTPAIIAPEVYQHLWNLVQKYYELAGINQQAAQAQKPVGLNSAVAQREYADQQTETLVDKGKRYEESVKVAAELMADACRELAREGAYEVRALADDAYETVDWRKLEDPDGYEMKISPTSSLPGTPAGRVQLAEDLLSIADIDAQDLMQIVGMPDILQKTSTKLASRTLVEKRIGEMLREGTPYDPHPFLNLEEAIVIATEHLNLAESKGVPDERLQLVRDFVLKANDLATQKPPAPAQNVAPGQPVVMAPGTAPAVMAARPTAPPAQGAANAA